MSGKTAKAARRAAREQGRPPKVRSPKGGQAPTWSRARLGVVVLLAIPVVAVGLYAITSLGKGGGGTSASHGSGAYPYVVGSPGPGNLAPPLALPSTTGKPFDLAAYRGKSQVLLYFQEGLSCQPCWDQIAAIEKDMAKFRALGIGQIVSITTDPLNLIAQKAEDDNLSIPVLSDSNFSVSDAYDARKYGMMGGERDGHSFILVGKNGRIRWRADYGGPPKFTMFLPTDALLADLRKGIST